MLSVEGNAGSLRKEGQILNIQDVFASMKLLRNSLNTNLKEEKAQAGYNKGSFQPQSDARMRKK